MRPMTLIWSGRRVRKGKKLSQPGAGQSIDKQPETYSSWAAARGMSQPCKPKGTGSKEKLAKKTPTSASLMASRATGLQASKREAP